MNLNLLVGVIVVIIIIGILLLVLPLSSFENKGASSDLLEAPELSVNTAVLIITAILVILIILFSF